MKTISEHVIQSETTCTVARIVLFTAFIIKIFRPENAMSMQTFYFKEYTRKYDGSIALSL